MSKYFKSPDPNFIKGNFKSIKKKQISPKRKDYEIKAKTKGDKTSKCGYINNSNNSPDICPV